MTEKAREYLDTLVRMLENKVRCAEFHKQIHVDSVKDLYDVVQSQIPKVIGQYVRTVKKEIESVKHGKFRKMFLAMVNATNAYRKEYHDFDKHKVVANCVVGTSSYQIFDI